ncbi:hypothetical protein ASD81_04130 [Nocardioides sp. Root614]|nr:hypothetical protein ASD81_04130 [Nocardioides sp. Root614]KRA91839.1 hypothetical protein ASD84_04395 [Nocardioides sp. Root682]
MAAIEIETGCSSDDDVLFGRGVARFRSGLHEEQLEVLGCFTDLAMFGPAERRRTLFWDVWSGELGPADPVMRLLASRSTSDAETLVAHPTTSRLGELGRGFQQELQRELAWLAVDSYIAHRDIAWLDLVRSPFLELRPEAAGFWEYELIRAVTELALGQTADATGRVRRLCVAQGSSGWRLKAIRRAVATYSALAAPDVDLWATACEAPALATADAASPQEELGAFMLMAARGSWSETALADALGQLEHRPTDLFLFLLQFADQPFGPQLARMLSTHVGDPARVSSLPWPGRENAFARACRSLPPDAGLPLLAAAAESLGTPQLRASLIDALERSSAHALDRFEHQRLQAMLTAHLSALSSPAKEMALRGAVYRAIVDGSNVVLAGVHSHDRPGRFAYYEQLVSDLTDAGFREIVTYFDAKLRHGFPASEWSKIEALEADRKAMVVRGIADVHVIRHFLEAPRASWIVTNDDYKDHLADFPGFDQYWFSHRLHFHVDQSDRIAWDRPLDSPRLPRGAPFKPYSPNRSIG